MKMRFTLIAQSPSPEIIGVGVLTFSRGEAAFWMPDAGSGGRIAAMLQDAEINSASSECLVLKGFVFTSASRKKGSLFMSQIWKLIPAGEGE